MNDLPLLLEGSDVLCLSHKHGAAVSSRQTLQRMHWSSNRTTIDQEPKIYAVKFMNRESFVS